MKTRSTRGLRRLLFKIKFFVDYADQVGELEQVLAAKPPRLQLDIIGSGELSPDVALLIRSVLLERSPKTHLITNARSSLQGGAVLIWLLGDTRLIREDAKFFFKKPSTEAEEERDEWKDEESEDSEVDLDEVDYAQVVQHIDNYLPVKELAGRALDVKVLRQFGLVDHEKVDQFLAVAFTSSQSSDELDKPGPESKGERFAPKAPDSEQANRKQ